MRKITNKVKGLFKPANSPSNIHRNFQKSYLITSSVTLFMLLLFSTTAHAQVNNTIQSLGIQDISTNPVVKRGESQRAALEKDKLYKPHDTDLITGRAINISKDDLDKYFPNGIDLSRSDAQLNSQLEERKQLYIAKIIFGVLFCIATFWWLSHYLRKRYTKRALL